MELLNGLLINLLFILIVILLTNMLMFYKHKCFHIPVRKVFLFSISVSQIVTSLLLSVPVGEGYVYDLRFIPFLLGGLYGGKRVTISLAFILLGTRFFIGGDGFWTTLFLTLFGTILIIWLTPYFLKKTIQVKVAIVSIIAFVYAMLGYLIPSFICGFHDYFNFAIYALVLTTSTFFVTYLLEILRTAYILQLEAIKLEKMEIVSHLAASISHEVRNPLTAVIGFLQLIFENERTDANSKAYAKYAIEEANRAADIINDYLTFAKPHSEEETSMSIELEVRKCIEILRPLSLKHDVEVEVFFQHTGFIKGDPHKFHQVLLNIFKNSIEAMPNGGRLTIITSEENEKYHIMITDTGHGMKPEHLARLGEPYFSLKEHKGTGLGMMVVFRIVESMNGSVNIASEVQVGTSITLCFPSIT